MLAIALTTCSERMEKLRVHNICDDERPLVGNEVGVADDGAKVAALAHTRADNVLLTAAERELARVEEHLGKRLALAQHGARTNASPWAAASLWREIATR